MKSSFSPLDMKWVAENSSPKIIGSRLHYYSEIDSTNNRAKALAEESAPEGSLVITDYQTAGRGRENRKWVSPAKQNLLFSFILRPPPILQNAPQITTIAAVAICDTIRKETRLRNTMIKWPNDIRIGEKKVAGILTEMKTLKKRIEFVVVGIGININISKEDFPESIRETSTSLFIEAKKHIEREKFFVHLMQTLDDYYRVVISNGFDSIHLLWKEMSDMPGKLVRIENSANVIEGYIMDIDTDGGLLIREKDGLTQKVFSGEIKILN